MMDPLDLPQIWQCPSYYELTAVLESLKISPNSWDRRAFDDQSASQESLLSQKRGNFTRYLSSIIKSPLQWIDDDDMKERIWGLAGKRISERCGRAALGDMVRTWQFRGEDDVSYGPFELAIKEPGMTEATLGLKTWASSYVLAQHLPLLGANKLFRLFDESLGQPEPRVLELGSGTGLLGLAAAALWKAPVVLSDLPKVIPNLKDNMNANIDLIKKRGGSVTVGALTWGGDKDDSDEIDSNLFGIPFQFSIVLVADPLYFDDHPKLLASAISENLAMGPESRAVVMVPKRDETTRRLLQDFKQAMLDSDFYCDNEVELQGRDDWSGEGGNDDDEDEGPQIRCWLGTFSRGGTPRSVDE